MTKFLSLEPAIDPNNRITFLLDWELTMKCNLDCSYCPTGLFGGHDNSLPHPPKQDCLKTIDFMFAYVDLYMATKPKGIRYVILNVYGGESLNHPDIIDILAEVRRRYEPYQDRWHLTVTTTTNAIVSRKKLAEIIPLIDEFTVSYHTEDSNKQKTQFKNNLLMIAAAGRRQKCVVLMHQEQDRFADAQEMISWLNENNIRVLPKQLDGDLIKEKTARMYGVTQVKWFDSLYRTKTFGQAMDLLDYDQPARLSAIGRSCCGERQTCVDQNYKQRHFYVSNKFPDWYCSVNHFFLYVKQINGEIYVNKDCKMNFENQVAPIGTLADTEAVLTWTREMLCKKTMPVIQCKKQTCLCGLCAPKAKDLKTYNSIMEKYYL